MKNIELNPKMGELSKAHGYELQDTVEYEFDFKKELESQQAILMSVQMMGLPAMRDYYNWLQNNGFSAEMPNPTNDFVKDFYGKQALWETDLSKGVVMKAVNDDDFYVVMECSRMNSGFKYTKIVLTLGGCM